MCMSPDQLEKLTNDKSQLCVQCELDLKSIARDEVSSNE